MTDFQPFEHEVMASQNEKEVDYNLSESRSGSAGQSCRRSRIRGDPRGHEKEV